MEYEKWLLGLSQDDYRKVTSIIASRTVLEERCKELEREIASLTKQLEQARAAIRESAREGSWRDKPGML